MGNFRTKEERADDFTNQMKNAGYGDSEIKTAVDRLNNGTLLIILETEYKLN